MRYEITIQADTPAFGEFPGTEAALILREAAVQIDRRTRDDQTQRDGINLYDRDGNHVGVCRLVDETKEQRA